MNVGKSNSVSNSTPTSSGMEEQDHEHKYIESDTPHFFKVILHDTLQSKKLVIPKSFVGTYGRCLSLDKVYLKVGSGDLWEMELRREEEGDTCLLNGWQEFVEFYNIMFGYFLVFGHLGNSEFQVFIFDKTTLEIKYHRKSKNDKEHEPDVYPCSLSVKPETEETEAEMLVDHNTSKISKRQKKTDCKAKGSRGTSKSSKPRKTSQNSEAMTRSTAFDSRNPYFQITMRPSYVNKLGFLWLPGKFVRDHTGGKQCNMKLYVPSVGRSWTVECVLNVHGIRPGARVQKGWKSFVSDNNLAVDDVCIFELIDRVKIHFQVTIIRAAKDPSFSHCPGRESSGGQFSPKPPRHQKSSSDYRSTATCNHSSWNPSFKIVMTEARMKRKSAPIQTGFSKYLKRRASFVTLKVGGRSWQVKVCFYRRGAGTEGIFSSGWVDFLRGNSLETGDILIFELVEREKVVLQVSIHRASSWTCLDDKSDRT